MRPQSTAEPARICSTARENRIRVANRFGERQVFSVMARIWACPPEARMCETARDTVGCGPLRLPRTRWRRRSSNSRNRPATVGLASRRQASRSASCAITSSKATTRPASSRPATPSNGPAQAGCRPAAINRAGALDLKARRLQAGNPGAPEDARGVRGFVDVQPGSRDGDSKVRPANQIGVSATARCPLGPCQKPTEAAFPGQGTGQRNSVTPSNPSNRNEICLAPRHGLEPRFSASKAGVLPLDDRGPRPILASTAPTIHYTGCPLNWFFPTNCGRRRSPVRSG